MLSGGGEQWLTRCVSDAGRPLDKVQSHAADPSPMYFSLAGCPTNSVAEWCMTRVVSNLWTRAESWDTLPYGKINNDKVSIINGGAVSASTVTRCVHPPTDDRQSLPLSIKYERQEALHPRINRIRTEVRISIGTSEGVGVGLFN